MSAVQALRKVGGDKLAPSKRVRNAIKFSRKQWTTWVAFIEFCAVFASAYGTSVFYHLLVYGNVSRTELYVPLSLFLSTFFFLVCLVDNQYDLFGEKWRKEGIARGVGAIALAFAFFLSLVFIFDWEDYFSRGTFLLQLVFVTASIVIARVILVQRLERAVQSGRVQGRGIVVISFAANYDRNNYVSKVRSSLDQIVDSYDLDVSQFGSEKSRGRAIAEEIERIRNKCRKPGIDLIVVIYDVNKADVAQIVVEAFYEMPVHIRLLPVGMIPFMQRSQVVDTGEFPTLEISTQPFSLFDRILKKTLDLAVTIPAIVLFSPLLLLVAIAIKFDSSGSVLFRQIRHGLNNEPIEVLKFRTMRAKKLQGKFQQTMKGDPRVTRVGRLLRRTNIDELPQLFNVLRGEMSVVGPRPHATIHNEMFADRVKMIYRRHNVKPGITGWAQVNGLRGATDTCEKMQKRIEYDLYYVDHWSIIFDIKILVMTLFSKKSYTNAY
jgi:Undecaprenyl-phosphate glucose phosphotransferase